jgi:hypothetical protein
MDLVKRWTKRRRSERGAELIEVALTLPLLLLVVLGIIDFGFLFQRYEVVTNAAREGARVAVLPGYGDADVAARVEQYLTAAGLTAAHDPPVVDHPPPVAVGGYCAAVTSVKVTYPHTFSFVGGIAGYFGEGGFTTRTLQATAEMRNEIPAAGCGP